MISITRSGVRNLARPISACLPTGPPITPESAAPIVSVRLGRSRSLRLRLSSAGRAGDTTPANADGDTVSRSRSITGAEKVQPAPRLAVRARVRPAQAEREARWWVG